MTVAGGNAPHSEPFLSRMQSGIGDNLDGQERRKETILRSLNNDDGSGRICGVLARMREDISDNLNELERREESISRLLLGGGGDRVSSDRSSSSSSIARPQERVVGGCESPSKRAREGEMRHPASLEPPHENYPEDGRVIGTDAIFSSENVIPPNKEKGGVIPLPSSSTPVDDDDGIPAPSITTMSGARYTTSGWTDGTGSTSFTPGRDSCDRGTCTPTSNAISYSPAG